MSAPEASQALEPVPIEQQMDRIPLGSFIAEAGDSLALHGRLVTAQERSTDLPDPCPNVRDVFAARLGLGIDLVRHRIFRIIPWIGLGAETSGVASMVKAVADGTCTPVVRVDPDNDRSIAFALRVVQSVLSSSAKWRDTRLDNEERAAFRALENRALPVPRTRHELLPLHTEMLGADATGSEGAEPGVVESVCWYLTDGPDRAVSRRDRLGAAGIALPVAHACMTMTGHRDRRRDEVARSDLYVGNLMKRRLRQVHYLSGSMPDARVYGLDGFFRALLILVCGSHDTGRMPVPDVVDLRGLRWPPAPASDDADRLHDSLLAAIPDDRVCDALMDVWDKWDREAPQALAWNPLQFCVRRFVNSVAGVFRRAPAYAVGWRTELWPPAPGLPYFLEPGQVGAATAESAVSESRLRWIRGWTRISDEMLRDKKKPAEMVTYLPGFSTLWLRHYWGLLLNPCDGSLTDLSAEQNPIPLPPRIGKGAGIRLVPITHSATGRGLTVFGIGLGRGCIVVVPAHYRSDEIWAAVGTVQARLGLTEPEGAVSGGGKTGPNHEALADDDGAKPLYSLRKGASAWELVFDGKRTTVKDSKGMLYVRYLLLNPPEKPLHATVLDVLADPPARGEVAMAEGPEERTGRIVPFARDAVPKDRNPGIDERPAWKEKLRELTAARADAEDRGLPEYEREQAAAMVEELEAHIKKHPRIANKSQAQRVVWRVRNAINRLLKVLSDKRHKGNPDPVAWAFAEHIRTSILARSAACGQAGRYTYAPPPGMVWSS